MAIKYNVTLWGEGNPARVLAQHYAEYIFNIKVKTDTPNMAIVAKGDCIGLDQYEEAVATGLTGKILPFKAANGNYYVEIEANPNHALVVYQKPLIEEESPRALTDLKAFYSPKDTTVRAYDTVYGDVWEVSEECFDGTPTLGAAVTIANRKFKV